jgi:hypothetical protein
MKRLGFVLVAAVCAAQAQQQTAPQRYLSTISVRVLPDKVAAFRDHYKTGAGAKTVKARIQANANALRWTLLEAVYPGDPAPRATHLIASVTNGAPAEPDPAKRDEMFRSAAGVSYDDYMKNVRSMSETIGNTIAHIHDTTDGYSLAAGDYVSVRRVKIAEGKNADYYALMRETRLKLTNDRVKEGNLKGWSFSHLSFPTGSSLPWDAAEAFVVKDLEGALAAQGGGAGGGVVQRFMKLFPNRNYVQFVNDLRETSKIVRTDLYRVVAAYSK